MRADQDLARQLRKAGKSYSYINKTLGIPKGTLSAWFSSTQWSKKLKKNLTKKANIASKKRIEAINIKRAKKWKQIYKTAEMDAFKEFPRLSSNPLFVAGLMLYWGEGDSKLKNPIRLSNTDPRMISMYVKFLTKILGQTKEKIRIHIVLYPDLNEKECLTFWSKASSLPYNQFYKTQYIEGKHPTNRLSHGICSITISNSSLKRKIYFWIDLLSKKL